VLSVPGLCALGHGLTAVRIFRYKVYYARTFTVRNLPFWEIWVILGAVYDAPVGVSSEIKLGSSRAGTSIPGSAPIVAGAFVLQSLASPGTVSISGGRPKLPREDKVLARSRGDLLRGKLVQFKPGKPGRKVD
jgi:hypothetical protein